MNPPREECLHCGLPIVPLRRKGTPPWAHDATLRAVLGQAMALGVAINHAAAPDRRLPLPELSQAELEAR